jgi:hypothetical protein
MDHFKTFKDFLLESTNIKTKEELFGKKMYHGTTLETWRELEKSYLFVTDEEEHAQYHAISRTEGMIHNGDKEYDKLTAVVFEIVIDEEILNLEWVVDDDDGNRSFFETWLDSYNAVGTFVIMGIDSSKFKEVFKEKITKETSIRYL